MSTEKWDTPSPRFNEWWDINRPWNPGPANPFEKGSAAFWAWEGWQAALYYDTPKRRIKNDRKLHKLPIQQP